MQEIRSVKLLFLLIAVFVLVSCATEVILPPPPPPPAVIQQPAPEVKAPPPAPKPPQYRQYIACDEDTKRVFNSCGVDVLPFVRPLFLDVDGDGRTEMVLGAKDGALRLYRNVGSADSPDWQIEEKYFDGITAGAFSAPAIGDVDNDGRLEVLLGTGGFSSESGKVVVYRNNGSSRKPIWSKVDMPEVRVGNDATPTLVDVDGDGKLDLIVGNSTGHLTLFRNQTKNGNIAFAKDDGFFKGLKFGMYVVPAATVDSGKIILITGDSMGKLVLLERKKGPQSQWTRGNLNIAIKNFAAPTFLKTVDGRTSLVVSDGDGRLLNYSHKKDDWKTWERTDGFFGIRMLPGQACTPSVSEFGGRSYMVVGNINGEIKLYEYSPDTRPIPWVESIDFFRGIKLSSFSKGVLAEWQGRRLLITAQQDGILRAFIAEGNSSKPSWREQKDFFAGIPKMSHPSPAVFDLYGNGKWALIIGDADGYVKGYEVSSIEVERPRWVEMKDSFKSVKAGRFASPSLTHYENRIYLFVGQQDGKIDTYIADAGGPGMPVFLREGFIEGIKVRNHSSPSVISINGIIDVTVGDYDGNLRHYACKKTLVEIKGN